MFTNSRGCPCTSTSVPSMSGLLVFFAHELTPISKIVNNESVRFISFSNNEINFYTRLTLQSYYLLQKNTNNFVTIT